MFGRREGTVLHSDSGFQYTSYTFRRTLVLAGMLQNLNDTAYCYDNARMEKFCATMKKEKLYQILTYSMKRVKLPSSDKTSVITMPRKSTA